MSDLDKNIEEIQPISDNAVSDLYEDWFLDYASYVILERAIPSIDDGFKPVQRRILHSMNMIEDGRYNKCANIIGSSMQYHPHGDASIEDALVNMGQKDLLIDTQGNWGNTLTGDGAAAPRGILHQGATPCEDACDCHLPRTENTRGHLQEGGVHPDQGARATLRCGGGGSSVGATTAGPALGSEG